LRERDLYVESKNKEQDWNGSSSHADEFYRCRR
jgi:hypothetical protein